MYVQQTSSILFFPKRNKVRKQSGLVPIYARITIDGQMADRAVKGVNVLPDHWDAEAKLVKAPDPKAKAHNKKLATLLVDVSRGIDLVQAKNGTATPEAVWKLLESPQTFPDKPKFEKKTNLEFSLKLDQLVKDYVIFQKKKFKAYEFAADLPPVRAGLLNDTEALLDRRIDQIDEQANVLFDEKARIKTVVLSIDEHLVHFMKLVKAGHRSFTTLQKMLGRKGRIVEFLNDRYKQDDLPLKELEYRFIEQLETYCLTRHEMTQNTASKYTATFKDIMTRSVALGWMPANIFMAFRSKYEKTRREWPTWEEMNGLIHHPFTDKTLNLVRDLYVFEAFTGYAYAEIRSARPSDFRSGIDGKVWLSKDRRKTDSEETLPLLPIALQLIEKYKDHPVCRKRSTLFPVPTNEHYNRSLKIIAQEAGTATLLITHSARYFFANEILYNNGVQLKTIAGIMGHDSAQSTEVYVRANRTATSESMEMVEAKLYGQGGKLAQNSQIGKEAKVVTMRAI